VIDEWERRGLVVEDLRELSAGEREEEARRIMREEAEAGFDLGRGPLLRVKLVKLGDEEHILIFTMHHIVSDGWSTGVLVKEVCALYEAMSEGRESPLPELEIQYADYAVWQREWLRGEVLEHQLNYWRQQLDEAPAVLELPTDRPPSPGQSYRGGRQSLPLSADLTAGLKKLSRCQDVTLFMTLMAAFQALLYRYSWQEDILIGTGVVNRNRHEAEHLIGFFVNMLVLRANLTGNPSFSELMGRVREVTLGAYAHQDVPFELLVEELRPERALNRAPLVQVVFVFHSAPLPTLELPGLRLTPLEIESEMTSYDLTMSVEETPQGLSVSLEYNTDLFDSATVLKMLKNYAALLEAMVAHPEGRVLEVQLRLEDESHFLPVTNPQNKPAERILDSESFHF
jgi:condensation domain-containing protein